MWLARLYATSCKGETYSALQVANKELVQGLASLVTVADILESLGGVLATDVKNDLLTTARNKKDVCQQPTRLKYERGGGWVAQAHAGRDLRVLVDELGAVVDLVVDDNVDVLLGVVLSNVLVGELLDGGGHCVGVFLLELSLGYEVCNGGVRMRMEDKAILNVTD